MSYLGYDRGRLLALRRRLGDLADEVAALRVDDPLAVDAARRYRDAATSLTDWRSELAAIDACGFSSPFRPVALDPADPAFIDLLRPGDAAWATVTDPRASAAAAVDPITRARHLAEYLAALDLSQVLGDEGRTAELVRLLRETGAGPALLAALGPERFGSVVEELATRVARDGASGEATAQAARARPPDRPAGVRAGCWPRRSRGVGGRAGAANRSVCHGPRAAVRRPGRRRPRPGGGGRLAALAGSRRRRHRRRGGRDRAGARHPPGRPRRPAPGGAPVPSPPSTTTTSRCCSARASTPAAC